VRVAIERLELALVYAACRQRLSDGRVVRVGTVGMDSFYMFAARTPFSTTAHPNQRRYLATDANSTPRARGDHLLVCCVFLFKLLICKIALRLFAASSPSLEMGLPDPIREGRLPCGHRRGASRP
jgi:hypothetical protein